MEATRTQEVSWYDEPTKRHGFMFRVDCPGLNISPTIYGTFSAIHGDTDDEYEDGYESDRVAAISDILEGYAPEPDDDDVAEVEIYGSDPLDYDSLDASDILRLIRKGRATAGPVTRLTAISYRALNDLISQTYRAACVNQI